MIRKLRFRSLLAILLIFLGGHVQAQVIPPDTPATAVFRPVFGFGIKGAQEYMRVGFTPELSQELTSNYTTGLAIKYLSLPRAGIQVELNYTRRGWTALADSSRQWRYLELPVLTHAAFGRKRSKFVINFGPVLSYLLSSPDTITLVTENFNPSGDYSNVPQSWQYGLSLGFGFSQQVPAGRFQLEARLSHGLSNALKGRSFSASYFQTLGLSLTYFIEIRKPAPAGKNKSRPAP